MANTAKHLIQYSSVLTIDNQYVDWPYSNQPSTSLKAETLRALCSKDALVRILACEKLTNTHISLLFDTKPRRDRVYRMKRMAERMRLLDVEKFCHGATENELEIIFRRAFTRLEAISMLMELPDREPK